MKTILFLIFCLPLFIDAQTKKDPVLVINGMVKGLDEGSIVFLTDGNKPTDTLARGFVKSGAFLLSVHLPQPGLLEINFGSAKKKYPLFLGNDNIQLKGNTETLKELEITGSSTQNDFSEFQKTFNPYIMQLNAINQMVNSQQYLAKNDSLMNRYAAVSTQIQTSEDQFIQNK
ncbi:MAG TPA: DUF4369 domain-containing protein, partial [Puia sp.]|nr:DUF4369 domain-containing protein [Puia sp.]